MRVARVVLCAALVACASDRPGPVEPIEPPPAPLPAGVHALTGISETLPHSDLEPLRGIIGSARFVALGESIHTSGGYYQAKFRLIRFMVEEMGFRVVTLESSWLEALSATRYVATCEGTPEAALAGLNGVWRDTNVRNLLRWLCEYNRSNPGDPVTFFGFDSQEPGRVTPAFLQFVQSAAPSEAPRAQPLRQCLGATHPNVFDFYLSQEYRDHVEGRRNAAAQEACLATISEMESWISANAPALVSATSEVAVEEARIALISLRSFEQALWLPGAGSYQARDSAMAEMLLRLHALHTPGKKTIVWAWNWHIARRYEELRAVGNDEHGHLPRQGALAMGSFLHERLGADYLPIALIAHRAVNLSGVVSTIATSPQSVEKRLHELGRPYLLVDLRQPLPDPLLPPGTAYEISLALADPYRQFGALVYLEHAPGMIPVLVSGP
jgi:erythromycin esterase